MQSLKEIQLNNELERSKNFIVKKVKENYESTLLPHVVDYISKLKVYFSQTDFSYTLKSGEVREWETKKERFRAITNDLNLESIAWKALVHATIQTRSSVAQVVGKIYQEFGHSTSRMNIESATDFIAILGKTPIIDIQYPMDVEEGVLMINSNITLDDDLSEYLKGIKHVLPMVVRPREVTNNKESGYLTFDDGILCAGKRHDFNVALDHINRLNSVALTINPEAAKWVKPFETKPGEPEADRKMRLAQFNQFEQECTDLYKEFEDKLFYLTHRYDERGRTYCRGYHFTYQGDDKRKAVIELANKEVINFN